MIWKIPKEVIEIVEKLKTAGFEAFIVGGCVRDILMGKKPKDWDIATSAKPHEIQELFPKSFYENRFFTVTVLTDSEDPTLKEIQITTFRKEAKYSDKRHPDYVEFGENIFEDLKRRDFTINAIAIEILDFSKEKFQLKIIDLFEGQKDLNEKIVRAVGDPKERFSEDALRMLRAVRFAVCLGYGWKIEEKTKEAIKEFSHLIEFISKERIRDELLKIINSERAAEGIELMRELNLLKYIIPELEEGVGVTQNKHHIYTCYEHCVKSLEYAAKKGFSTHVRLAALFHDIGKPRTKRGEGPNATFYNHEVVGAKMTEKILRRLKFPSKDIEKIVKLVRYHLFYYNPGEVKEGAVRRLLRNVGKENIEELLQLRMADRIGSGVKKAEPYKLRHLRYMIEKVSRDPISPKMLKVNGNDIMEILKIGPGPRVGWILKILLEKVVENPQLNEKEILIEEIKKLGNLSDEKLKEMANLAQKKLDEIEQKRDEMTKKKYWVV
jgi:poly(A) polymerase/tRNA nucleotidyltransferase (CCA-adding enzyme)